MRKYSRYLEGCKVLLATINKRRKSREDSPLALELDEDETPQPITLSLPSSHLPHS